MDKGTKGLVIFFAVCIIVTIASIILSLVTKDKNKMLNEQRENNTIENYNLIKENIFNLEENNINKVTVNKKDTPSNPKETEFLLVRKYYKQGEGYKWELSGSVYNLNDNRKSIKEKWDNKDLESIPVIVFAIYDRYEKTYTYQGGHGKVYISTEGVKLYFYNTKTKTVFKVDELKAKPLPDTTTSTHNYTYSLFDVESKIKKDLGMFVMPAWLTGLLLFIGLFILPVVIITLIKELKNKKKEKKIAN